MIFRPALVRFPLRSTAWTLAAVALLSACSSPAPQASTTPWSSEQLGLTASASTDVAGDWWTTWGDARLQSLIRQALQDHPNMQQAQARVRRMQAVAGMTHAASLPQVGLGADFSRQRYSATACSPTDRRQHLEQRHAAGQSGLDARPVG